MFGQTFVYCWTDHKTQKLVASRLSCRFCHREMSKNGFGSHLRSCKPYKQERR